MSAVLCGNGTRRRFTGLALNTDQHPLSLNRVAPSFCGDLTLVDLDCLVRSAYLIAALHVPQHRVVSEPAPVRDRIGTETMLSLVKVRRYAAHDICEEHNLESKVTPLKPLTLPYRRRRRAYENMSSEIAI